MFYDAQIAGLPDTSAPVRMIKKWSAAELLDRRGAVIDALRQVAELTLINGGGTGSLHITSRDRRLTELAGGSGLYAPTFFDHYRDFRPQPAAYFVTSVVRKPSPTPRGRLRRRLRRLRPARLVAPTEALVAARHPTARHAEGRRRGADPTARTRRRRPADRGSGLVPPCQGR